MQTNRTNGRVSLRRSQQFTGVATALQASSNTYLTGFDTTAAKSGAPAPFYTFDEGKRGMRRKRIKRYDGKPAKDGLPVLEPSLDHLATVLATNRGDGCTAARPLSTTAQRRKRRCAT